jgi:hypothetical protein
MPVRKPRKRYRVQNLATESRQKRKDRTQGNHESQKELAIVRRKMNHCAEIAQEKHLS